MHAVKMMARAGHPAMDAVNLKQLAVGAFEPVLYNRILLET